MSLGWPEGPALRHQSHVYADNGDEKAPDISQLLAAIYSKLPGWMRDPRRHCLGYDIDNFYGTTDGIIVCEGCPFQSPCLQWAIENQEYGVWGGTSERARKRIRVTGTVLAS